VLEPKALDPEIRGPWKGLKNLIVVEVENEVISTKKKRQNSLNSALVKAPLSIKITKVN